MFHPTKNKMEAKFLKRIAHAEIAVSTKLAIDLQSERSEYGNNFNTITILNTSTTSDIEVYLDGTKIQFVTKNNGAFSLDWRDGLLYNMLEIENTSAADAVTASQVKISVGRTGTD